MNLYVGYQFMVLLHELMTMSLKVVCGVLTGIRSGTFPKALAWEERGLVDQAAVSAE